MFHSFVLAVLCMMLPTAALAHGTGQHVLGTVVAIDSKHLEVKTQKGTTVEVLINKQTRFKEKGNPKGANLPSVGDRVVVEAIKDDKALTATEVHFSSLKKTAEEPAPLPQQTPAAGTPSTLSTRSRTARPTMRRARSALLLPAAGTPAP